MVNVRGAGEDKRQELTSDENNARKRARKVFPPSLQGVLPQFAQKH